MAGIRLKHACHVKTCTYTGVLKYGLEIKKPISCPEHKTDKMFDVYRPYCITCLKEKTSPPARARYGINKEGKFIFCKKHNVDNLPDMDAKRCIECAKTLPIEKQVVCVFALPGGKPKWCKEHAPKEAISVRAAYCTECPKYASFGLPDDAKPSKCGDHKTSIMVDLRHAKCEKCTKQATLGFKQNIATRCADHKEPGMFNVKAATCAYIEEDGARCSKHRHYGFAGGKKTHCAFHAETNMVDLQHPMCSLCGVTRVHPELTDRCKHCFHYENPGVPLKFNFRTKELRLVKFVQGIVNKHENIKIIAEDKRVPGGCSNRRPDCAIDCSTHIVIVECDENQHGSYNETCDNKRTMQIFKDCGSMPIIFMRFNPDAYNLADGGRQPACFKLDEAGKLVNTPEWYRRIGLFEKPLISAITTPSEKEVDIRRYFYDEPVAASAKPRRVVKLAEDSVIPVATTSKPKKTVEAPSAATLAKLAAAKPKKVVKITPPSDETLF